MQPGIRKLDKENADHLDDLILELSLVTSLPIPMQGRNYIQATSAANSFSRHTDGLDKPSLKQLSHGIKPLLTLLWNDIDLPVAAKAAQSLKSLMPSRACMLEFLDEGGLDIIGNVFQKILNGKKPDLVTTSTHKLIVEHCTCIYREVARFYPWKVIRVGGLRHIVLVMRFGDIGLKTTCAGIFAGLSMEEEICKQMFTNGAVRPIIEVALLDESNEPCLIACLGSIVQLTRIPEIAAKVYQQGAMPLLEKTLHATGYKNDLGIREKALYSLYSMSNSEEIQKLIPTESVLAGMSRELKHGTPDAQLMVIKMALKLHNKYPQKEEKFVTSIIDEVIRLLKTGPFVTKNLCAKCVCVLYRSPTNQMYLVDNLIMEALLDVMQTKSSDLHEAFLVALLSLISHPDVPARFFECYDGNAVAVLAKLVLSSHEVVRGLAVVILKALTIYGRERIMNEVPKTRHHLFEIEDDIPVLAGEEYGGMIQEYLQFIVENRRDQEYLLDQLDEEDWVNYGMSREDIRPYQETFQELDPMCKGYLDIDELKVVMVTLGYLLDEDELQEILDKYAKANGGFLNFREFMYMIIDWNTRFGSGMKKVYNTALERGPIGRARRTAKRLWNKRKTESEEVREARRKRQADIEERKELAAKHWEAEKIRLKREEESKRRAKAKRANAGQL